MFITLSCWLRCCSRVRGLQSNQRIAGGNCMGHAPQILQCDHLKSRLKCTFLSLSSLPCGPFSEGYYKRFMYTSKSKQNRRLYVKKEKRMQRDCKATRHRQDIITKLFDFEIVERVPSRKSRRTLIFRFPSFSFAKQKKCGKRSCWSSFSAACVS